MSNPTTAKSTSPLKMFRWVGMAPIAVLSIPHALALDATASLDYTAEYTTNTARTESGESEGWIHTPGVNLGLSQESAQLELDGSYRFERRYYDEVFDSESAATGSASAVWHALPERLDLTVRNTRTETTRRSIDPGTEANRQEVSTTEAGPTLRLRPRSNSDLLLEYLYTDISADETRTDSERHTGTLSYIIGLSPIRSLGFAASHSQVDFDNPLAPDLDVTIGAVTYAQSQGDFAYDLTAGYNWTERDQNRDTVDGPIFLGRVNWNLASETVLALEGAHQITDRSSNLLQGQVEFGDGAVSEDSELNEIFTETRGSISLSRPFGNNDVSVNLTGTKQDYEDVLRDSERYSVGLTLDRGLNPRTDLRLYFDVGRRKFTNESTEQDELRGALEINRELTRRLNLTIGAGYQERESDRQGDADGRSYEEWTGRITLRFQLLGRTGATRSSAR